MGDQRRVSEEAIGVEGWAEEEKALISMRRFYGSMKGGWLRRLEDVNRSLVNVLGSGEWWSAYDGHIGRVLKHLIQLQIVDKLSV
jgi:hypothetical protein